MKHITTIHTHGTIKRSPTETGQSIEETIRKALATNQPLEGTAPMIYTPAADGVHAEYDIRTDKQLIAIQAMDKYQASDAMKGFITQTEYGKDGTDGNGNKKPEPKIEQPKDNNTKTE